MKRTSFLSTAAAAPLVAYTSSGVAAQSRVPFRVGIVWSYTGAGPAAGPELDGATQAFQNIHGTTVAGRPIEIVRRDDGGNSPEVARRLAQELIVEEKVSVIAGLIFTANARAVGDIANQAKIPVMLVNAPARRLLASCPYMTRWSFTTLELARIAGTWAGKSRSIKTAYTICIDNETGLDAQNGFAHTFQQAGGTIVGSGLVPLAAGEFSAYIQRAKDAKPDTVFVFLNAGGMGVEFLKQYNAAGLKNTALLTTGDLVSENDLPQMGDAALGIVSVYHYSSTHHSLQNRQFQSAVGAVTHGNPNPSFAGVAMWDVMQAIYAALLAQHGDWDSDRTMAFLRGYRAVSARGPIEIDAESRDITQNIYLRRVERVNGSLTNVEFQMFPNVKASSI